MADDRSEALRKECYRLVDTCLYTSTTFYIWLRFCRFLKTAFLVVPLVCGSLGTWSVLTRSNVESFRNLTALFSFLAGLLPAVYAALKLDRHLDQCCRLAGEFKNLQDRFRQAGDISFHKTFPEFEADVQPLFKRLEKARSESFTAPEWCFKRAQNKINKGDYTYTVDEQAAHPAHPVALQYITANESDEHEDKHN
ncbi:hypothetical protein [Terriglobus sp. TAA 43]|uniref:hypothetical protein n=1 Tax=Terriglobus sp. TAA 43 TaxID=278961 RepID=UPI000647D51F|nr:hypothetical protein [Terriglobus sp. TAA 43]